MKKTLFLSLAVLMTATAFANPVEPETAAQVAKNFVTQYVKGADQHTAAVVYTHPMPKSGVAAMYAVNVGSAFVLVSADDVAHPVLGYSLSRPWPTNETISEKGEARNANIVLPSQIAGYLDDLAGQIESAAGQQGVSDQDISSEWRQLLTTSLSPATTNPPDSVGPLLTTTWDQDQYYNALCPEDGGGPDGHAYAGCVATAMAQIINYWGYPVHGRGIHSYQSNYGILTVNYDSATYDYANMPDALTATSTPAQVNAVATLMRDCGVAANMNYGFSESSSYDVDARAGMINFFRISPNASYAEKIYFTNDEWNNLLRTNLASNQPLMYSGHGTAGHSFVCDGYKTDNYYHFNFGWSGYADGWYLTDVVNPAGSDYNSEQSVIVGIVPDSTGNVILGQMAGTSTFTVDEPLEFYHLMGHNAYTGTNYGNAWTSNVTFISSNPTTQLVLDILSYEAQNIIVYDGNDGSLLTALYAVRVNNISPVVSTAHGLEVVYQGEYYYTGFKLSISQDNGCRIVSNPVASVDTTSVHLTWTENGSATQWEVEYGTMGFQKGTGVVLTTDTTELTIDSLNYLVAYDFYIRPVCHNVWFGPFSARTDMSYWQDIVTEEPEGVVLDSNGNVLVSTPGQLTWFLCDSGTTGIKIVADIDLSGHRWRPVKSFYGDVDGDGHVIHNLIIREPSDSQGYPVGFFSTLSNGCNNMVFRNPYIDVNRNGLYSIVGVLAGTVSGTVKNCGVIGGTIDCNMGIVGGLVGVLHGSLENSFTRINIINHAIEQETGGLVGKTEIESTPNGYYIETIPTLRNCYSASKLYITNSWWQGQIVGYGGGTIEKCYGIESQYPLFGFSWVNFPNTTAFDTIGHLRDSITIDDTACNTLLQVLNHEVYAHNDTTWRVWLDDVVGTNDGYPLFGSNYVVTCPNVSNLEARNVKYNNQNAVRLTWNNCNASYIIRCINHNDTIGPLYYSTDSCQFFLLDLSLGEEYQINVKCVCDELSHSGWGEDITHIFAPPYWTDVVTEQPDGYELDGNGNVIITTAEGLAWLASCVNGLNGETPNTFAGKRITILSDIDLAGYRWMPIGINWDTCFWGNVNGGNRIISNVYINEKEDNVGLFGFVYFGKFSNIILQNISVRGRSFVGGLCGYYTNDYSGSDDFLYDDVFIDNCHVKNANIYGGTASGCILGTSLDVAGAKIRNCSTSGNVFCANNAGGIIGNWNGGFLSLYDGYGGVGQIHNCYSSANIVAYRDYAQGYTGGLVGYTFGDVQNCYSIGNINPGGSYTGKTIGVLDYFGTANYIYSSHGDTSYQTIGYLRESFTNHISTFLQPSDGLGLTPAVTIGDSIYTNLLTALNAWVDANDTAGIYRHWAADSANVNGGFPVFAAIPCTTATGSDSIIVCDSYTWHGNTYTTSTELIDTLSTLDGCDSIVTHYLIVNYGSTGTDTVSAMESYTWADSTYTASGIYPHTWPAANDCDSTVTLWLTITRTVHDTTFVDVHDTTYVNIHDTTYVQVHDTTYITVHDTTYMTVYDTTYITVHDTTYIDVPYPVHDTTYIDIYDTTYVYVHDTTYIQVHDTTYIDVPYLVHDTVYINVYVHDTTYIDVPYPVHDTTTVTVYVHDTVTNTVHDTTLVTVTDTLWLTEYDTIYITLYDTVYIYDTVYVGVDNVEAVNVKLFQQDGAIVVEGAEGHPVWLYDVVGRMVNGRKREDNGKIIFDVPASGVYLVKVGDAPARRIVVIR